MLKLFSKLFFTTSDKIHMKGIRKILLTTVYILLISTNIFANETANYQNYELDTLLHEIEGPVGPVITEDYIIFTCDSKYRYAGIAFDFEGYKKVHPFQVLTQTDENDKKIRKFMFYVYKRQHKFTTIKYRLILDGLWTTDPLNTNIEYDDAVNLYFSKIEDPKSVRIFTEAKDDDSVRFIYKGEPGLEIHLSGTFTNWDPWIYQLKETAPGFYELTLPLTSGTYYYQYYIGLKPVLDNTNPEKIYTTDGRSASVITVK